MGSEKHTNDTPEDLAKYVKDTLDEVTAALRTEDAERYIEWTRHLFGEKSLAVNLRALRDSAAQRAQALMVDCRRSTLEPTNCLLSLVRRFEVDRGRQEAPASVLTGVPGTGFALREAHLDATRALWPDGSLAELGLPLWMRHKNEPMAVMGLPSPGEVIEIICRIDTQARREGLLALEDEIESLPAPIAAVLQLIVDGTRPELVERFWNLRVDDARGQLSELQRRSANAAQMIQEGQNPRLISEIIRPASWATVCGEEPATSEAGFPVGDTVSELFAKIADAVLRNPLIDDSWDLDGIIGEDAPPWARVVARLLLIFLYQPDVLDSAIALYFDRLNRELQVAADLVRAGARFIQGREDGDIAPRLRQLVPEPVKLSAEQTRHIGPTLEQWHNPEPVFRGIEDLAFLSEEIRRAAHAWKAERVNGVVDATSDEERLRALVEELASESVRSERHVLEYADAVHHALSSSLQAIDDREGELTRLYARHTATPHTVRDLLSDTDRREFVDALVDLYTRYDQPLDEDVRRQMALRNTELEKLLQRHIGSGNAKRWAESEDPGISAFYELGSLDLALGATPFAADERRDLIERWSRADATVGRELAARDVALEDLAQLTDISIQKVLREVATSVLAIALMDASPRVVAAVTRNMSRRAETLLREDMAHAGEASPSRIRAARTEAAAIIRKLRDAGEIGVAGE